MARPAVATTGRFVDPRLTFFSQQAERRATARAKAKATTEPTHSSTRMRNTLLLQLVATVFYVVENWGRVRVARVRAWLSGRDAYRYSEKTVRWASCVAVVGGSFVRSLACRTRTVTYGTIKGGGGGPSSVQGTSKARSK